MLERISLRPRLAGGLLLVALIPGLTAMALGVYFISRGIIAQAQSKVRLDLNTAREVYQGRIREIQTMMEFSAIRPSIWYSLKTGDHELLGKTMLGIYHEAGFDILNVTDAGAKVVFRCGASDLVGDDQSHNVIVARSLAGGTPMGGTQIVEADGLRREGAGLAERTFMKIVPTRLAIPSEVRESKSGMMMMAAAPVRNEEGGVLGVIYGGYLLNRRNEIVDRIKDLVYQGERYQGHDIGTSTIFQHDIRIATNVLTESGGRAVGTQVSRDVYARVLLEGKAWIDRAFVVNAWYISAYEPVRDVRGTIVGMLYVGMLEKPYRDLAWRVIWVFLGLTGVGIGLALGVAYILSHSILRPIRALSEGARRLAGGELDYIIEAGADDEIGGLCRAFNSMAKSLLDRDRALWESAQSQLSQSQRLASVGRLAAGVAHELNNPLTGVLTFSSLLLEDDRLPGSLKADIQVIVDETTRCREIVRDLLDFARETEPELASVDVNDLIRKIMEVVPKQRAFKDIRVDLRLLVGLPTVVTDEKLLRQVLINLIMNAVEAMPKGGALTMATNVGAEKRFAKITVQDTGVGIATGDLERIFEPFFTTKSPGKGTGLGLAVSYGIIQKLGGTLAVSSQVGFGSIFEINLPLREGAWNHGRER